MYMIAFDLMLSAQAKIRVDIKLNIICLVLNFIQIERVKSTMYVSEKREYQVTCQDLNTNWDGIIKQWNKKVALYYDISKYVQIQT